MGSSVGLTNGVVLDPFSIHLTGLLRKNRGIKSDLKAQDLFSLSHGEARFKQAFVNACHFAESMTVVGPVAQMTWSYDTPDYILPALMWRAGLERAGNEFFAQSVQDFLTQAGWTNIAGERWLDRTNQEMLLHMLPDFSLSREIQGEEQLKRWGDHSGPLFQFLFRQGAGGYRFARDTVMANLGTQKDKEVEINSGAPVLGLMAVTFTFKKPAGVMAINELTNLASWPPVTFFLPVLVPSGSTMSNTGYTLVDKVLRQPPMATYRLSLNNDKHILPYGQPYLLTSVRNVGKAPDTLRSLSDVFKALWSQATLYSAWNMEFRADLLKSKTLNHPSFEHSAWESFIGEFSLEPLGAGRRIRGHNRYMSKHRLSDVSFLWEDGLGINSDPQRKIMGWNLGGVDKRPFMRQLRSDKRSGNLEAIFVLPSYMTEDMRDSLLPVAMGMAKFMFTTRSGLEVFLDSSILSSIDFSEFEDEEEIVVSGRKQSFVDCVAKAMHQAQDKQNVGALPVRRVKGDIGYDPDGDPSVFGLSFNTNVLHTMAQDSPETQLGDNDYNEIVTKTGVLGNFHFLDAFCSKSTKDLTDVFGEVKKKSFKEGTKASKLLDETLTIDLFDEDIGML